MYLSILSDIGECLTICHVLAMSIISMTSSFSTRFNTNRGVRLRKMAIGLKLWMKDADYKFMECKTKALIRFNYLAADHRRYKPVSHNIAKLKQIHISHVIRKHVTGLLTRSDTYQAVQQKKMARGLNFFLLNK